MNRAISLAISVALILLCGCSSAKLVKPADLEKYESTSSFHNLWYMGSDGEHHYFSHYDKIKTKYKVPKSELRWEKEVPLGELKEYILVLPGTIRKGT